MYAHYYSTWCSYSNSVHFSFPQGFIDNNYLLLHKEVVDLAHKDKDCAEFDEDFKVELFLDRVCLRIACLFPLIEHWECVYYFVASFPHLTQLNIHCFISKISFPVCALPLLYNDCFSSLHFLYHFTHPLILFLFQCCRRMIVLFLKRVSGRKPACWRQMMTRTKMNQKMQISSLCAALKLLSNCLATLPIKPSNHWLLTLISI